MIHDEDRVEPLLLGRGGDGGGVVEQLVGIDTRQGEERELQAGPDQITHGCDGTRGNGVPLTGSRLRI